MIFHIINSGDYSVGISAWSLELELKGDLEDMTSEGFTDRMKQFLLSEFGEGNGATHVMTQEELDYAVQVEEQLNEGI